MSWPRLEGILSPMQRLILDILRTGVLCLLVMVGFSVAAKPPTTTSLEPVLVDDDGRGVLPFHHWPDKPLRVFVSVPKSVKADTPVIIIFHGNTRNAQGYRDSWHRTAQKNNVIAVVPEFSSRYFPKIRYRNGNVRSQKGKALPQDTWLLSGIEPLFEHVREQFNLTTTHYSLYGHSAGAQVVHRFLYFVSDNRASRIVIANAGTYTMPMDSINYVQGIKGVDISNTDLTRAYAKRVIVLVGDQDNDPKHPTLDRSLESMRQGPHRFSRGHRFYMNSLFKASVLLKVPFNWSLSVAPGVGHSNKRMVRYAAPFLLEGPLVVH